MFEHEHRSLSCTRLWRSIRTVPKGGYLVPASLHAFHGKVDRHIHPGGDSYIIFPTLLDAERAIREAGFEPSLQQGARSFPDRRAVLPKRDS